MNLKEPGIKEEIIINISKKELMDQILLPKSEWSDQFNEYIKKKIEENKEIEGRETRPLSDKEERLKIFKYYLKDLDLTKELIKGKTILDLGCGEGAEFAMECSEEKLADVYGIDRKLNVGLDKDKFKKANFLAEFPFRDKKFDFIISNSAVVLWLPYIEKEEHYLAYKDFFKKYLGNLKENGEIRIYSLKKASSDLNLPGIKIEGENLGLILELLSEDFDAIGIKTELKPIDIGVSGEDVENCDVWLNQLLVIKHKNETNNQKHSD